ncbi:MAG: hypothetical protein KC483_10815 [Nitrosarchaeum sp.]|nr:hypothetical protein [Nitrosarchaeum sp.]
MKAFHGIPELKEHYLGRIAYHMEMDHLAQGCTWEANGKIKGCAIGCTFENYRHQDMQDEWDVPIVLAKLEDRIFEGLPIEKAKMWPMRFTSALKVGKDYSLVWPKFALWFLNRLKKYSNAPDFLSAIDKTIKIYYRWVSGENITSKDFRAYAADVAVYASAYAAVYAAVYAAAYAADAAAYAAVYAAYAADAADAAACFIGWEILADKLIEIIEEVN